MIMRVFTLPLLPLAFLAGCSAATPPMPATTPAGIDLGSAPGRTVAVATTPARTATHTHDHGTMTASAGDVPGHGTIEAVDPGRRRVTLSHVPMPEIGWPAMTMVFPVPGTVDLRRFKPNQHVDFTLRKGSAGSYDLIDLRPGDH